MASFIYKMATEQEELEQIHQLNYKTFVEEIPQHQQNDTNLLVDKFHDQNTYVIAKCQNEVIGMIAVRSTRPFSLDQKMINLDAFLPANAAPCEIRLLSVKQEFRSTQVFYQLCERLLTYCLEKKYNMALISGTVRQLKLYRRIGFEPFGELVGEEGAKFQPMALTKESFETSTKAFQRLMSRKTKENKPYSLLPGPVQIHSRVESMLSNPPISHRSMDFKITMQKLREKLCAFTGAVHAQVVIGTGTLANDLVAAQLKTFPGEGLILANGEFGYRLIDHARRFNLSIRTIEKDWNDPITLDEVDRYFLDNPTIQWLWTVHCETSTGYLFDIKGLLEVCQKHGVELCVDACSSVGVVPVDFSSIYLASTVSGKGLGSYPGLAIVFHREMIKPSKTIPRYLDLGVYEEHQSIPFTHSSNLILALTEALKVADGRSIQVLAQKVKVEMKGKGFRILGEDHYSPGIITFVLPQERSSQQFGDRCKELGVLLSYESNYLLDRNWVQIALMGAHNERDVMRAIDILERVFTEQYEEIASVK